METGAKKKSRIFLLDSHETARRSLARLIASEPDLLVCGEASGAEDALAGIRSSGPEAVVIGVEPMGGDGPSAIELLRWEHPSLPLIVVSLKEAGAYGRRMLQAGAAGYVTTARASREIIPAIRKVLSGGVYGASGGRKRR